MNPPPFFALIVPLANEADTLFPLAERIRDVLDTTALEGRVFWVVDTASQDDTRACAEEFSATEKRFKTLWAPQNRHLCDAYRYGLRVAYRQGARYLIEMDGGGSHDPAVIPQFLEALRRHDCAWGSRFVAGGRMEGSLSRRLLSRGASWLTNRMLGTRLRDMTSGFQGFRRAPVRAWLDYEPLSSMHFYQTEMRYQLRHFSAAEVPIHYRPTSKGVPMASLQNAAKGLWTLYRQKSTVITRLQKPFR